MSSGTRLAPGRVRQMLGGLARKLTEGAGLGSKDDPRKAMSRIARLGLTPRQQELNWLWAWYRCQHYDARKVDWNGKQNTDYIEHEAIATAGFLPPGFYDAGATFPLKFRRPSAPYALVKVVVDRFTGLLFSERHHPAVREEGDTDTEDFLNALVEESRLWPQMIQAREYGGAMGSVAVGFQFLDGRPVIEVHDPRWCFPEFIDRFTLELKSLEKRYIYEQEVRDPVTGVAEPMPFWYRRIIDQQQDILFQAVPVGDGDEPDWDNLIERQVAHGLGFCPVQWIQNLPVQDDIDGDPDCIGIYDLIESVDSLLAQANKGIICNCDPTLVISTDAEMSQVLKGSDNAIKLPNGSANYLEITGQGPKSATELAEVLRKDALEVAQCVLEHPEMSQRTATEIERVYSSMLSKADILREQYGEKGIKPLLRKMVLAARKLGMATPVAGEGIVRQILTLPPKPVQQEDGSMQLVPRQLGPGGVTKLQWPRYFDPLLADVELATRSAGAAKLAGLIDEEHASKYVAEFFGVEDVLAMLKRVKAEQSQREQEVERMALNYVGGADGGFRK